MMSDVSTWAEAVAHPIISTIGQPCSLAPPCDLPAVLSAGEIYGLWSVPFTLQRGELITLFSRFGLWQSSLGLMQYGKHHRSFQRTGHHALTQEPILVGDWLDNQPVIYATNRYNDREKSWSVYVLHGTPPLAKEVAPHDYAFYQSILESQQLLAKTLLDLTKQTFNELLPLCTAGGYPLLTTPAQAIVEASLAEAEEAFRQAFQDYKEHQWH